MGRLCSVAAASPASAYRLRTTACGLPLADALDRRDADVEGVCDLAVGPGVAVGGLVGLEEDAGAGDRPGRGVCGPGRVRAGACAAVVRSMRAARSSLARRMRRLVGMGGAGRGEEPEFSTATRPRQRTSDGALGSVT